MSKQQKTSVVAKSINLWYGELDARVDIYQYFTTPLLSISTNDDEIIDVYYII